MPRRLTAWAEWGGLSSIPDGLSRGQKKRKKSSSLHPGRFSSIARSLLYISPRQSARYEPAAETRALRRRAPASILGEFLRSVSYSLLFDIALAGADAVVQPMICVFRPRFARPASLSSQPQEQEACCRHRGTKRPQCWTHRALAGLVRRAPGI